MNSKPSQNGLLKSLCVYHDDDMMDGCARAAWFYFSRSVPVAERRVHTRMGGIVASWPWALHRSLYESFKTYTVMRTSRLNTSWLLLLSFLASRTRLRKQLLILVPDTCSCLVVLGQVLAPCS